MWFPFRGVCSTSCLNGSLHHKPNGESSRPQAMYNSPSRVRAPEPMLSTDSHPTREGTLDIDSVLIVDAYACVHAEELRLLPRSPVLDAGGAGLHHSTATKQPSRVD